MSFPFSLSFIRRMDSSIFLRSSPAFLALSIARCRSIFSSECIRSSSSTDGTASEVFLNKTEAFDSGTWYELSLAGMVCGGSECHAESTVYGRLQQYLQQMYRQWILRGRCGRRRTGWKSDESGGWRRKSVCSDYSGFPRLLILSALIVPGRSAGERARRHSGYCNGGS